MPINFIFVAIGFISVSAAVVLRKNKRLFEILLTIGLVLFVLPFVRYWILTRDAYEWTIVVERNLGDTDEPEAIFIERIEWITDYEVLKRQRGHVRSFLMDGDTTRHEWRVKGYIPIAMRVETLIGNSGGALTRNYRDLEPGAYTFTLTFDENNVGRWSTEATGDEPGDGESQ